MRIWARITLSIVAVGKTAELPEDNNYIKSLIGNGALVEVKEKVSKPD